MAWFDLLVENRASQYATFVQIAKASWHHQSLYPCGSGWRLELAVVLLDAALGTRLPPSNMAAASSATVTLITRPNLPPLDIDFNDIKRHMQVNFYGVFALVKAAVPLLQQAKDPKGPKMIFVGSGVASFAKSREFAGPGSAMLFNATAVAIPASSGPAVLFDGFSIEGVSKTPVDSTAMSWRNDQILFSDIRDILQRTSSHDEMRTYVNYAFGNETFVELYGSEQQIARLPGLKCEYDPDNMFLFFGPPGGFQL
ncbi:hypothetical protein J3E74DRAFT_296985 [Bipolaris maydis]|nr:hypothetical protein J3E74DRAFT_296985 [Bipolaris maydis]